MDFRGTIENVLRNRGYDNYPADEELFEEVLDELNKEIRKNVFEFLAFHFVDSNS